jgi:hypothetical protein
MKEVEYVLVLTTDDSPAAEENTISLNYSID